MVQDAHGCILAPIVFFFHVFFFFSAYASNLLNSNTQDKLSFVPEKHLFPCAIINFPLFSELSSFIPSSSSDLPMTFCSNAMVTALHALRAPLC